MNTFTNANDTNFMRIVERELRNQATPAEIEMLESMKNQWREGLLALTIKIDKQLSFERAKSLQVSVDEEVSKQTKREVYAAYTAWKASALAFKGRCNRRIALLKIQIAEENKEKTERERREKEAEKQQRIAEHQKYLETQEQTKAAKIADHYAKDEMNPRKLDMLKHLEQINTAIASLVETQARIEAQLNRIEGML